MDVHAMTDAGSRHADVHHQTGRRKTDGHYVGTLGESDFIGTNNGKDFTINSPLTPRGRS
jgi:hypothetical protein